MKKLWQKNIPEEKAGCKLSKTVEVFETKGDLVLDQNLVEVDVWGSLAHARMLRRIGVLSVAELKKIEKGLQEIITLNKAGGFKLQFAEEDIHTKIENYITEKYGEAGQKMHTGRSRNDQVLTDLRLFTKQKLLSIWQELIVLSESFLQFAQKYEFSAMPGYTHMQKAMPSSVGMWSAAFAESFLDDLEVLKMVYRLNNQSPLGSAASYGVPIDLDREYTASLLGFEKVQNNSLYCQNSRGKIEGNVLASFVSIMQTINKFASDILLFTTAEFNFFTVADELCSGSSIMPQKRNVDVAELLRSKLHLILGNYMQIVSLSSNLVSGYNRDLQDAKKPLIESLETVLESIKMTDILINNITPNKDALEKSLTPEIFATHKVMEMVKKGVPFREAYREVLRKDGLPKNAKSIIKDSKHAGGTGNLGLKKLLLKVKIEGKIQRVEAEGFGKTINGLMGKEDK